MCTVSYIPLKNGFILTSNRDEQPSRITIAPKSYTINNKILYFPKDTISGGTWILTDLNKITCCLLNGCFEKHIPNPPYRKSRGQILIDIFSYSTFEEFMDTVNLDNIEPFTLLLFDIESSSYEFRWDGQFKYVRQINTNTFHLWQSATLYEKDIQKVRFKWFENWINKHKALDDCNIWNFHCGRHSKDTDNNIIMKRTSGIQTVSVTQVKLSSDKNEIKYLDVLNQTTHSISLIPNHV
ncbi:MAG: hypothetical protein KatS3mg027_0763 [Bacteroidia bacterium]|nr:MAG: hypothetical protein KatS3mg027_0763 [Bacteroidia bacterium]